MRSRVIDGSMFFGASHITFEKATELRKNMTLAELILWKKLKNRKLFKIKFRRQHPINIFIVDFYCHECKLAIEIDGEIHQNKEVDQYDSNRSQNLEKLGITILRFSNDQVILNIKSVIKRISEEIQILAPLQGGWGVDELTGYSKNREVER